MLIKIVNQDQVFKVYNTKLDILVMRNRNDNTKPTEEHSCGLKTSMITLLEQ